MSLKDDVKKMDMEMFEYAGKQYTPETFADKFNVSSDQVTGVIRVLELQGKIKRPDPDEIIDKEVRKALEEAKACEIAQSIVDDGENEIIAKEEQKRQGRHIYEQVSFDFTSMSALKEFRESVAGMYLESEVLVDDSGHGYSLRVKNLSDKQLNSLSTLYKLGNAVKTTVQTTTKAFDTALDVTDYTAKKIVVPVAKIGLTGMLGITKSLVSTAGKLTGIAVAETIKTARETSQTLSQDESLAIAKGELLRTKNELMGKVNSNSVGGNGIHIN